MAAESDSAAKKPPAGSGAGFSPRIYPRPQYESLGALLARVFKDVVWQSGVLGVVLTLLCYPGYLYVVRELRVSLGDYGSDQMIFTLLSNVVHFGAYFVINGSFGVFDYFGLFQEYKLARKPYMTPTAKLITGTLMHATLNQFVINPLATYYLYPSFRRLGLMNLEDPLPSIWVLFGTYCFANVFNGVGFYLVHRTVHSKALYALIHKQHHEYTGTMGIAAEHANPIEAIFANMAPTLGGVILAGTHPLVFCLWLFLRLQQTYETHSGYCFKDTFFDKIGLSHADQCVHHDYHHTVNTGNFGTEWMDWIFGTQDGFVAGGAHNGYVAKKLMSKSN